MTVAADPSPWYTRLATYKTFGAQHRALLASLIYTYLAKHEAEIAAALGGGPDYLTIVPSTRGLPVEKQPLRGVLRMVQPLEERFQPVLTHVPGCAVPRNGYRPECFTADPADVDGTRALVIEDTWVTGAKAVSAAGALLDAGAASVLILPVARRVQPGSGFHRPDHPYFTAIQRPYDISFWPPSERDDFF
ncbi:MAG: hypothetical protein AB1941_05105 [Gemmatimonadota bacterium]